MFKNLSLNITILIALIIGLFSPILFTTIYLQHNYEKNLKNELINTNTELLKAISSTLSTPMWNYMPNDAKKTLEYIFKNKDFLEIKVLDSKFNKNTFLLLEKKTDPNYIGCKDSQIISLEEKISLSNIELGSVILKFNTCSIIKQINHQKNDLWNTMTVQFLISFIVLFLIIRLKVITPINKLIEQSSMLAKKKLEKSFTWKQKDEVGKLGHSLEDTRLSLVELFGKEQKAQDKIEELNTNLEIKVKNEIKKNEFKTRQLIHKSKLAQTGELLNMIAHQWRQPLNSISVISNNILFQMMLKKPTDKEKLKEDINSIVNHTQYLSSTITEFREFYKLDKEKEITTFENIIVTTLQIISPSLKGNCIKVVKNFNCFKDIKTLPSEIVQVLLNLLKNAEDILIENQVEHPIIVVNTYSKKDKAYLEIIDNAGGISKENIDVIFDPYFTTKESKEGTGLGLYMSKMIIEDHCNGSINVKNNETGAIFEISVDLIS